MNPMILPPATLGMLGGGQLGRFFVSAAHELGYQVWVLDPDKNSPAGQIAERHFCVDYADYAALDEFAAGCAAIRRRISSLSRALWLALTEERRAMHAARCDWRAFNASQLPLIACACISREIVRRR